MPVRLKSSDVQQSFGHAVDRALLEDDVIVERYGTPRVAIVEYKRYQRLIKAEQEVLRAGRQSSFAASPVKTEPLTGKQIDDLLQQVHSGAAIDALELESQAASVLSTVQEEMVQYVVTREGQPVAVLRPLTGDEKERLHQNEVQRAVAEMRDLARMVAAAWTSDKSAVELVSEQRR